MSGHLSKGSTFQQFVDQRLVGLRLFGGQAAELSKKARSDADSDQLLGVSSHGPTHTARAAELLVSCFPNVGKFQAIIRPMPYPLFPLRRPRSCPLFFLF